MRTLHKVTEKKEDGKFYTEWYDETYTPRPNSETYNCESMRVNDRWIELMRKELEKAL